MRHSLEGDFDPYDALLRLNDNQLQLDENQKVLVQNQEQVMKAINHHSETVKQLLLQNQQLSTLLSLTRQELHVMQAVVQNLVDDRNTKL